MHDCVVTIIRIKRPQATSTSNKLRKHINWIKYGSSIVLIVLRSIPECCVALLCWVCLSVCVCMNGGFMCERIYRVWVFINRFNMRLFTKYGTCVCYDVFWQWPSLHMCRRFTCGISMFRCRWWFLWACAFCILYAIKRPRTESITRYIYHTHP